MVNKLSNLNLRVMLLLSKVQGLRLFSGHGYEVHGSVLKGRALMTLSPNRQRDTGGAPGSIAGVAVGANRPGQAAA